MARVKISAVYDSFARDDQPPLVVHTKQGDRVLVTGEGEEYDVENVLGISLQQPLGDVANELTKPQSDMSKAEAAGLTRPKTADLAAPPGPKPEEVPGAGTPAPQRGMQSTEPRNVNERAAAQGDASVRDPADVQRHPTDPLDLLK